MPEQQVLWTALPRSATDGHLELEVFVSPRLGVGAPPGNEYAIADFPEWEHWPQTLEERLTFAVELADGTRHPATVVRAAPLDRDTWGHLFRSTTVVRPWTFRDLSGVRIHTYSVRFVVAYLKELYTDLGRRYPTLPPPRAELDGLRQTVGPVVDVRVGDERAAPPRREREVPLPPALEPDGPAPEGCLAGLLRVLERLCRLLRPLCRRLPPRLRFLLGLIVQLLQALAERDRRPPPDPTQPKVDLPRVVHPSPYATKAPLGKASLPHLDQLEQELAANLVVAPSTPHGAMATALAARDTSYDFARAKRYFEREESETPPANEPSPQIPRLDAHQALGALGDYPELMRRLGLVVRLRLPRPDGDPGSVRVLPRWDGAARAGDIAPRTRCTLAGERFVAAHRAGAEFSDGMLELTGAGDRLESDTPQFDVVQVDSDGAALKAIVAAASLERAYQLDALELLAIDRPERDTTPALRSGGLAIVRADRAWHVHRHLVAAAAFSPQPAPAPDEPAGLGDDLWAEDLVRGYRIEVSTENGPWLSLCSRVGTYDLVDDAGTLVRRALEAGDEGYVKRTSASSKGDGHPLYVHEAVARWTGWSLVAQRPGMTLENEVDGKPSGPKYDNPQPPRNESQTEFRLVTTFHARPGSLPRLRFGSRYRLRALCVDLAGELVSAPQTGAPQTDPVTYRRFEPLGPPAALALRGFLPGESLERLVVRSDWDRDSASYDALTLTPAEAQAQRTRHLFAPKTSQQMAEQHGKLDAAFGAAGDPAMGFAISARERGTFSDPAGRPFGTPLQIGDLWVNATDATLPTPYLADPLVAGAALRGVPGLVSGALVAGLEVHEIADGHGGTEPLLQIPYAGTWPEVDGLRLRVAEQTSAAQPPEWDRERRLLTVFLAKAGGAEVKYSSYLFPAGLDDHGIWDWLDDDDPARELRRHAEAGAHWMITPARTLVLVHATQRPLATARFTTLLPARDLEQTSAELTDGVIELDVASTGRIDVLGSWTEWLDDPVTGVRKEPRHAVACDFHVREDWTNGMTFPPPEPGARARQEFGDTRRRTVAYGVRATTRFREYLPVGIATDQLTRDTPTAELLTTTVRSSARPIAPGVLFAVPTFRSDQPAPGPGWHKHSETRGGGGLRVFLDRPWYASGEGELLGVVLQRAGGKPLPETLRSRYGLDPIWAGTPPADAVDLVPAHFTNAVTDQPVRLAEPGKLSADVVGFAVEWDAERRRWVCDIELDLDRLPWSSWPFVRFAFVRFQPESVKHAEVSKVVLGEFGQVAPDRALSLTWQGSKKLHARLSGAAPSRPFSPFVAFRVQTTTVPAGQVPDELDWTFAAGHTEDVDDQSISDLVTGTDGNGDGLVRWDHEVDLPAPRGTERMRLEVAEYEFLRSDEELGRGIPRVTYAAHVPLD